MFGSIYSMIYSVFWISDDVCVVVCQDAFGNVISISSSDDNQEGED
jgi:hypothetical protein